jgi:hypothetical protein
MFRCTSISNKGREHHNVVTLCVHFPDAPWSLAPDSKLGLVEKLLRILNNPGMFYCLLLQDNSRECKAIRILPATIICAAW